MRFRPKASVIAAIIAACGWARADGMEIWPYEPVFIWVPTAGVAYEALNYNAKITKPDGQTVVIRLVPFHGFGVVPNERRALMGIFDLEHVEDDLFVAPGRYLVTIDSNPEKSVAIEVKELSAADREVADLLKRNVLFWMQMDGTGPDPALKLAFERVLEKAPESPYALYARVYLAIERYWAAFRVDREKLIGKPAPDFSVPAQRLVDELASPLQTSSWPLRGLILVHRAKAQGMLKKKDDMLNTLKDVEREMPVNRWSRIVDQMLKAAEKEK